METPLWARAIETAQPLVTTPADALARVNAALTQENDCSQFWLMIAGGSDPVSVHVSPSEVRRILSTVTPMS
jgi:hypothetical protein